MTPAERRKWLVWILGQLKEAKEEWEDIGDGGLNTDLLDELIDSLTAVIEEDESDDPR